MASKRHALTPGVVESNAEESGASQTAVQESPQNGESAQPRAVKRKKQKGPRTVFYMACTVNPDNGRCTEVTRAETRNQLDKKMQVIREAFGTSYEDLTYLQCRSL